jgi:hypothetical protein
MSRFNPPIFEKLEIIEESCEDISLGPNFDETPVNKINPTESPKTKSMLSNIFTQMKKSIGSVIKKTSFTNSAQGPSENYLKIFNLDKNAQRKTDGENEIESQRLFTLEEIITESENLNKIRKRNIKRSKEKFFTILTFQKLAKIGVKLRPESKWKRVKQFYNGIRFNHL